MSKLEKLKNAKSINDLAELLGYRSQSISYILYIIPNDKKYINFQIPKKNGELRNINSPISKLKSLQSRLSDLLSECYDEIITSSKNKKSLSHGFKKKHSIITNAKNHINRRYVFNIDLDNFFPSINFGRIQGYFIKNKYFSLDTNIATYIAQIACYNNELPQGSPCSPIISNLIGHYLDIKMVALAKKTKCTYSRYADDLTFSTNKKEFPESIAIKSNNNWEAGIELKSEIEKAKFSINVKKTSMQYKTSRQITTGLVVNKKINISNDYYKITRAYCDSLFKKNVYYIKNKYSSSFLDNKIKHTDDQLVKGSITQLEGNLNFIFQIKKIKSEPDRYKPNSITRLFRQFLLYKHFFALEMPLIICEGKTDIIYLKCALNKLYNKYVDLITKFSNKFIYKIHFLKFSLHFKDVFHIPEGTSGINFLMEDYKKYSLKFQGIGKNPIIIILDTDQGSNNIRNKIKNELKIDSLKEPFIKYFNNLYIIFISEKENIEIEDLFDEEIRNIKINNKPFNSKKNHADESEYGKHFFAEKVIKAKQEEINYNKFIPIFDKIIMVLDDYKNKQTTN